MSAVTPHFALPATATSSAPPFTDLSSCQEWIGRLPRANPPLMQKILLDALRRLNAYTLPASIRLALLEALQAPLHFVQEENASLFAGKPLPLAPIEQSALDTTHALWQGAVIGYLHCLESLLAGESALASKGALVCQRALTLLVADFADLLRGGWQPDGLLWKYAHRVYASAERLGVAQESVAAAPSVVAATPQLVSPTSVYVVLVLLAMAGLYELAPRQQRWVMRWAHHWAGKGKVKVLASAPPLTEALPLCVDLGSDAPPRFLPYTGPDARWLDTRELHKSLMTRIVLLSRGDPAVTPASLGLGEDCQMPACLEVLQRLFPRWVRGGVHRRFERHPLQGPCRFVAGVDAIHFYVSGHRRFRPPGSVPQDKLRQQREAIEIFDTPLPGLTDEISPELGFQTESWTLAEDWRLFDHSEGGVCLVRPIERVGGRLAIGQLVAVQPTSRGEFLLGVVRWAQRRGNELATGIQLLAGRPEPVAVRRTGVMATPDPYQPGFILPADSGHALRLILPPGSFKAGRIMETWTTSATRRFRIEELVERGADFELVRCVESK